MPVVTRSQAKKEEKPTVIKTNASQANKEKKEKLTAKERETVFIQELITLLNYDNSGSIEYKIESATKAFDYVNKHFVSIVMSNPRRFHRFMAVLYNKTTDMKTEFETNQYNNSRFMNSITMTRSYLANYFHSNLMNIKDEHPEFKDTEFIKAMENVAMEFAKTNKPMTSFKQTSKWPIDLKTKTYKNIYRYCMNGNLQLFQKLYSIHKPMIQTPEIVALLEAYEKEQKEGKETFIERFIENTYLEKLGAEQWGFDFNAILWNNPYYEN